MNGEFVLTPRAPGISCVQKGRFFWGQEFGALGHFVGSEWPIDGSVMVFTNGWQPMLVDKW